MEYEESSLRDLLTSPYGQSCGQSILDTVMSGQAVAISLADGRMLTLESGAAAIRVLEERFGWTPKSFDD